MNKVELIERVYEQVSQEHISKKNTKAVIEAMISEMEKGLSKDGSLLLVGFGKFTLKHRPKRKGRHPITGETITFKARKTVKFHAGKLLKQAVNEKE